MARRHHYKRRSKGPAHEIDVTTFLNLMVVLVPFLLITAVFSRLTIVELNLPSSAGGATSIEQGFRPEVVVRADVIEITNGSVTIASIPKVDEEYDLERLQDMMISLKKEYPEQNSASVLMERLIPYDYLIQVMDVVRSVEIAVEGSEEEYELYALFTEISVGDAP
ncbi:MAG: ExbD/TolR family protein [Woeseiaceae bacterium]